MNNKREVQSEKQVRISSKVLKKTTLNKVKEKARIKLTRIEDMYRGDPEIYTNIREFDPSSG